MSTMKFLTEVLIKVFLVSIGSILIAKCLYSISYVIKKAIYQRQYMNPKNIKKLWIDINE